jgi:DNA-binding response OmpR family regulator
MKIIVLDDSKVIREYLKKLILENLPEYEIQDFEFGQNALDYIDNVHGKIDIIFLDIIMPEMDGLEFLEKVKKKWPLLPVIMLTSLDDKKTIKNALKLGASDFIEKPFTANDVIPAVKEILEKNVREKYEDAIDTHEHVISAQKRIMSSSNSKYSNIIQHRYKAYKAAGGDFFTCKDFDNGKIGIIIADAAGHSVETSYFVAEFKGVLNSVWDENQDPLRLLKTLNEKLCRNNDNHNYICITAIFYCL